MHHIKTDDCNMVYLGPEPGIGNLHCRRSVIDGRGRTAIFSVWTFTDEERKALAEGANIELALYHEPIPPISIIVTTKTEAKPT